MKFPETLYEFPRSIFGAHVRLVQERLARSTGGAPAADLAARVQRLEADRSARELVHAYMAAFDAKEIDLLLSLYTDDALLVNSFGTWRGPAAIRSSHEHDFSASAYSFHNVTNASTLLADSGTEAWVSGYLYNVADRGGAVSGTVATCLFHLRQTPAGWKVAECRTAPTSRHGLAGAPPAPASGRPEPSDPQTSKDLIGA